MRDLASLRRDIALLGCMTDQELVNTWFDGSSCRRAKLPGKTPTLLEMSGIGEASTAAQFCEAIDRHLLDRDHPDSIKWEIMSQVMGMKRVLPGWSRHYYEFWECIIPEPRHDYVY
jgi:hypothetical protein